jgi:hypothetical protein
MIERKLKMKKAKENEYLVKRRLVIADTPQNYYVNPKSTKLLK